MKNANIAKKQNPTISHPLVIIWYQFDKYHQEFNLWNPLAKPYNFYQVQINHVWPVYFGN